MKVNDLVFIEEENAFGKIIEIHSDYATVEFSVLDCMSGGCLNFQLSELKPVWCITTDFLEDGKSIEYLAWQNPAWDDDGFFWTNKETMKEIYGNNTFEHRFLFATQKQAISHLKKIHIPQRCRIVQYA